MTDGVFYLKAAAPKGVFGPDVKQVSLDPVAMGLGCGGADAYCSTAYSQMWSALGGAAGVVPALRKKYGVDGRVAFVSFSAGHGFMNPLLNNDADRADTSAVLLLDSTFGGGKTGYVKAAQDAVAGRLLLATATSDKGSKDALSNGDYAWRTFVLAPAGLDPAPATAQPPMPAPSEGVFRQGSLWYYRFSDAELHHWDMGKILKPFLQATLVPYWAGSLSTGGGGGGGARGLVRLVLAGLAAAATIWAVTRGRPRRDDREGGA